MSEEREAMSMADPMDHVTAFHRVSGRHSWALPDTARQPTTAAAVSLPAPALPEEPLAACLTGRLSCRNFAPETALELAALGTALHAAYGAFGSVRTLGQTLQTRPAPSASGFYRLGVLVLARAVSGLAPAIYRYVPDGHTLNAVAGLPLPDDMDAIFIGQAYVAAAAVTLVITGQPADPVARYHERAYRFLLMEAGHAMQNLALTAVASGLGCCPIGGFEDFRLCCACGLDPEREWPLYTAAFGPPALENSADLRTPHGYAGETGPDRASE